MRTLTRETPPVVTVVGLILVVFQAIGAVVTLPLALVFALFGLGGGDGSPSVGAGGTLLRFLAIVVFAAAGVAHLWAAQNLWRRPSQGALLLVVALLAVWPVADWYGAWQSGEPSSVLGWFLFPVLTAGLLVSGPSLRFASPPARAHLA